MRCILVLLDIAIALFWLAALSIWILDPGRLTHDQWHAIVNVAFIYCTASFLVDAVKTYIGNKDDEDEDNEEER